MWRRFASWIRRLAGYGPCFYCGTVGFHSWTMRNNKDRRSYTSENGTRAGKRIRYRALLQCDGLCKGCFDERADRLVVAADKAFQDFFEAQ